MKPDFNRFYDDIGIPVLVCKTDEILTVIYMNTRATLMFAPSQSVEDFLGNPEFSGSLEEILHFQSKQQLEKLKHGLKVMGRSDYSPYRVAMFDGTIREMEIYGNTIELDGQIYYIFTLLDIEIEVDSDKSFLTEGKFTSIVNAAMISEDADEAIQSVLAAAGEEMKVSRSYIFEEISPTTTRNTYEWCAEGVEPAIQGLQNLDKEDYPYDVIVESGMFVVNDIMTLDAETRSVLEVQGIKGLAIITIYGAEGPLGYVGFDETDHVRRWSHKEIQFLTGIALFLSTLMKRRDSEQLAMRSQEILKLVTDNADNIIYANDPDDYTLLFVSKAVCDSLDKTEEELLGRKCYEVFRKNETAPCANCPISKIPPVKEGDDRSEVYEWENLNEMTDRTYLARDNMIKWVDGRMVHMEVAFDISERKAYEQELHRLASTDTMTGVMNREWGGAEIQRIISTSGKQGCLCFADLDGLKKVNDQLGHAYGDEMLIETVNLFKKIIEPDDIICRWGGDEFLMYFNAPSHLVKPRIELVQQEIEEINSNEERAFNLSFSYGMIDINTDEENNFDAIVTKADERMYRNKLSKRGVATNRRRSDRI